MAATLLGTSTGVTFGCIAETGILINSFSIAASSDKTEVKNANGDVALIAISNPKETISVSGTIAGTTGLPAATIGASLTFANIESVGGVATGLTFVESVTINRKNDGFKEISLTAFRYPSITA